MLREGFFKQAAFRLRPQYLKFLGLASNGKAIRAKASYMPHDSVIPLKGMNSYQKRMFHALKKKDRQS